MTGPDPDKEHDELERAIRLRRERRARWEHEGERSLWENLSMVGALGWLIVVPMLLGIALGRWLDTMLGTGIFWTGAGIGLGAGLGFFMAWKRMNQR